METGFVSEALYGDLRAKTLRIPGAVPGAVVAYEYVQKDRPFVLQEHWTFQERIPAAKAILRLELPKGWEYGVRWRNFPEQIPTNGRDGEIVWELKDLPAIKREPIMPPARSLAGRAILSFYPREASAKSLGAAGWKESGRYYYSLIEGRTEPNSAIRTKAEELTASLTTPNDRIRALAEFVQNEIRYVSIQIGIGGLQPHAAPDVFANRYGDCKD